MKKLGSLITTMRKSRKMSQETVAQACGVSRSAVAMWESDTRIPSRISLEALADLFNVPIASFLGDDRTSADVYAELIKQGTSTDYYTQNSKTSEQTCSLSPAALAFARAYDALAPYSKAVIDCVIQQDKLQRGKK